MAYLITPVSDVDGSQGPQVTIPTAALLVASAKVNPPGWMVVEGRLLNASQAAPIATAETNLQQVIAAAVATAQGV